MNRRIATRARALGAAVAIAAASLAATTLLPAHGADQTLSVVDTDNVEWKDYPGLPGIKVHTVWGNPKEAGLYVVRVKFAPHTMSRPHYHPEARYVTVLKGTWWAGEGDKLDPEKTVPVKTGGFAYHAPKMPHYDGAKDEEVIVQIMGIGPSGTIPVGEDAKK